MPAKKAIIVGGSMGGLLMGNMLVRQGWEVVILERVRGGLEARGAGITPQRALLDAFALAGVTLESDIGIRISQRVGYDRDGKIFAVHPYQQFTTSWGMIYNLLRDAFPDSSFHTGRNVSGIAQNGKSVAAILDDGSQIEGDLLIGADGMHSTVRRAIFPAIKPRYVGYLAWRGMLDEGAVDPELAATAFKSFSFGFPRGEELIAYPVAGADGSMKDGERRFNFMWYRPVAPGAAFRDMFTGTDGAFHENGIPPPLIRPEIIAAAKADAPRLLPPQFAEIIESNKGLFLQAIYDLISTEMGSGRVALIGDAAFVARPHCGAGVSKAAADAACLTRTLSSGDDIENAIAAFSAERTKEGRAAVEWAARLGSYFQMDNEGRQHLEETAPVTPEFIIRNTGIELAEAFKLGETKIN